MGVVLSASEVEQQSKEVYAQFGEKWKHYASINVQLPHEPMNALSNCGIGKVLVCAAMGESLEDNIETLRRYRHRCDIIACDKSFGILMEQGIKADYVMICDTNIPRRWLDKYIDDTADVKLICTPYANIEWTMAWKGKKYFYVSRDAIQTEQIFSKIFSLDTRIIPASSNVSNSMLVYFLTIDDNNKPLNWGGYEKYFLVGYDYSWRPEGKYYAYEDPKPKRYYMNHHTLIDVNGDVCFSSENLIFSAKWMYSYLTTFNMPVYNCSNRGILDYTRNASLEKQLSRINPDKTAYKQILEKFNYADNAQRIANRAFDEYMEIKKKLILQEALT